MAKNTFVADVTFKIDKIVAGQKKGSEVYCSWLSAVSYFWKKFQLRCLTGLSICLWGWTQITIIFYSLLNILLVVDNLMSHSKLISMILIPSYLRKKYFYLIFLLFFVFFFDYLLDNLKVKSKIPPFYSFFKYFFGLNVILIQVILSRIF